jgi:hypothetical protein
MEEELRDSLRALAWARYSPLVEHYPAIRAMSDDEYLATLPPDDGVTRSERLGQRDRWALDEAQLRAMAREEADRALPVLLEARRASGTTGPATELEYHQAVMTRSNREIRQMAAKMRARALGGDPRQAEILDALAEAAEEDALDFQKLEGDVTEEQLQGVTDRMLGRMHSAHQRLFGINPN